MSDKEASVERALDAARGPYGEGINVDRLIEELESAGWRWDQ